MAMVDVVVEAEEEECDGEGDGAQGKLPKSLLLLLCMYCFCLQFTPSEPYLVPLLTSVKQFSNNEVATKIFPVSVYCTLLFTLLAAPACTYLKYRSVILIGTFGRLATFIILLAGKSLLSMQLMQVTYSLGVASDLVFSSYLFVLVEEDMFQSLTSFTQAASTFSFLIAAELSQLLVSEGFGFILLLYISIFMVGLASIASIFFPKDKHRGISYEVIDFRESMINWQSGSWLSAFQNFLILVKATWRKRSLQYLSLWWAFQVGGSSMIENYGTNLFDAVNPRSIYNGHVIAATQGASCLAALVAVPISNFTARAGGLLYVAGSGATWLLCLVMVCSKSLWIVYLGYISCVAVNRFLLCVLYVQCAQLLPHGHYIFLFSLNAVAALLIQCLLQTFVEIFAENIIIQFYQIGNYFLILTITSAVLCGAYFFRMGTFRILPVKQTEVL